MIIVAQSPQLSQFKPTLTPEEYLASCQKYLQDIYQLADYKRHEIILSHKKAISSWLDQYGTKDSHGAVIYQDKDWRLSWRENTIKIIRHSTSETVLEIEDERAITYQINSLEQSKLKQLRQNLKEKERTKQQNRRRNYERER